MQNVLQLKILALAAVLVFGAVALNNPVEAADTLTDAITLQHTGVSDEVLIAWAGQQPPVAKTDANLTKLKDAKLSAAVIDALLLGNTRKAAAAPAAPKPAVPPAPPPPADDSDIRLAGNADDSAPLIANQFTPTVVIDGNRVYNYDPFHTVVYGWPYVYSIYPWAPDYFPYRYDRDWRPRDWTWNDPRDSFRWQNQTTPTIPNTVTNHPPHWPQRPEVTTTQPAIQNRPPHFPQRDPDQPHPPTVVVRTPPANVETHVTNSGVKYVTETPQAQSRPTPTPVQPATPQYYVPPSNNSVQPQQPGGFRR